MTKSNNGIKDFNLAKTELEVFAIRYLFLFIFSAYFLATLLAVACGFMDEILMIAHLILGAVLLFAFLFFRKFLYRVVIDINNSTFRLFLIQGARELHVPFDDIFDVKRNLYIVFNVNNKNLYYKDAFNKELLNALKDTGINRWSINKRKGI